MLVRASRYFLTMGIERLSVEEAKNHWLQGDLSIYAMQLSPNYPVFALPKREVEVSIKYLRLLEQCKTYGEMQKLWEMYDQDLNKPRILKIVFSLLDNQDFLLEHWQNKNSKTPWEYEKGFDFPPEYEPDLSDLLIEIEDYEFILDESPIYHDESGSFIPTRDAQVWTDFWIPSEIALSIGVEDRNYGMDYLEAELLYPDLSMFCFEFNKYSIETQLEHPDLRELAGY